MAEGREEQQTIRCEYVDVGELADEGALEAAMALLPWPSRREKALRYLRREDRALCVGAGLLLADMLREAGVVDLAVEVGEKGKPFLVAEPSVHFNLAHAGTVAACAVSGSPVGVDVEAVAPLDEGLVRTCLTDAERAWLAGQAEPDRAFMRLWCRKESYLKLRGCGLEVEPSEISTEPGSSLGFEAHFFEYHLRDYVLCVCAWATDDETGAPCCTFAPHEGGLAHHG
jgi:phosphopantetheinyl transferase